MLGSTYATDLLDDVATSLVEVRVDLAQYSETYYFRDADPAWSLAATVRHVQELVVAGRAVPRQDVRLAADVLAGALEELCELLDRQYLDTGGSVDDVLAAYAAEHGPVP